MSIPSGGEALINEVPYKIDALSPAREDIEFPMTKF
jgi:hypothetical protein